MGHYHQSWSSNAPLSVSKQAEEIPTKFLFHFTLVKIMLIDAFKNHISDFVGKLSFANFTFIAKVNERPDGNFFTFDVEIDPKCRFTESDFDIFIMEIKQKFNLNDAQFHEKQLECKALGNSSKAIKLKALRF